MDAAFKDLSTNPNIPARERRKRTLVRAQFEFIINASDDAIISQSVDGLIKTWNPEAETMFGFTADEIIGRSIEMILPADRRNAHDEILANLLKGQDVAHLETVRRHQDGHVVEIAATMAAMRGLDGQITGFSRIAKDIGERKRFESAQKLLEAQLRQSQKMEAIGTLAGGLASRKIFEVCTVCRATPTSGAISATVLPFCSNHPARTRFFVASSIRFLTMTDISKQPVEDITHDAINSCN